MKRKSCLALAFLLILLPLLGTFGTLGVSAENAVPEYRFSRLETMVTLNGVADAAEGWDAIEWADLAQTGAWNTAPQEGFAGRFKAFWQTEGEQLYLCFLVEVNDDTVSTYSDWRGDAIWFNFDDGARFNTSTILIGQQAATTNAGTGNRTLSYAISDQRATTGTYTVEARYPVNTVGRFLFDILLQDNCMAAGESTNRYVRYAWGGLTQSGNALAGTGTLSGDLFGVSYNGCNLYGTAAAMTLDGQVGENEAWNAAPWCGTFKQVSGSGIDGDHPAQAGFGAQFKSLWQKDGDAAYLWFLVEVTDATVGYKANSWLADYFGIAIDENGDGTNELDTAAIYIPKRDGYDPPRLEYKVDDRRAAGNGYTIEMKYTFSNAANCEGTIKFDLLLNDNIMSSDSDSNRYVRYSWKGIRQTNPATPAVSGTGLLSQVFAGSLVPDPPSAPDVILMKGATVVGTLQKGADGTVKLPDCETSDLFVGWVNEAGALYAVGAHYPVGESSEKLSAVIVAFGMMPGAAVKVENPTSIRFAMEFSAGWEAVAPFVKEKEIVIAEANLLTDAILADHAFTAQELSAAGIAADVCPVTAERTETGYRLSGEKEAVENAETVYAACGSFTVAFADGSTHTHTAVYDPAKNARSVREVAQKAYAERSNIRLTSTDGIAYLYKVSIRYAVGDFLSYSFSPYTADQLEILLTLIGKKPE